MFNKTQVFPAGRTEYVPYEKTVIEKRAPTDDSIRIYEEIKEKAYKSILDTIEINDNSFNVKAFVYNDETSMEWVCKYSFYINGREITGKICKRAIELYDKEYFVKKILLKVSQFMALELAKIIGR